MLARFGQYLVSWPHDRIGQWPAQRLLLLCLGPGRPPGCASEPASNSAIVYKSLLGLVDEQTLDVGPAGHMARADSASSDEVRVGRVGDRARQSAKQLANRGVAKPRTPSGPSATPAEHWSGAVCWPVPQPGVGPEPADDQQGMAVALATNRLESLPLAAASSGEQSSSCPAERVGNATRADVSAPSGLSAIRVQESASSGLSAIRVLEASSVLQEEHGVPGTPGHYRRLLVVCDHHSCGVLAQCKKTRSFGVRSMVRHGLGELEPYAFLGAWLERRGDVDSKAEHVAWTPSAADVLSYARRKLVWQG